MVRLIVKNKLGQFLYSVQYAMERIDEAYRDMEDAITSNLRATLKVEK